MVLLAGSSNHQRWIYKIESWSPCYEAHFGKPIIEQRYSLPVISETLGHTNTQTTMNYLRIDINNLQALRACCPMVSRGFYDKKEVYFMSNRFVPERFGTYFNSFIEMKENMGFGRIKFQTVLLEFDRFFSGYRRHWYTYHREQITAWSEPVSMIKAGHCTTSTPSYGKSATIIPSGIWMYIPRLPGRIGLPSFLSLRMHRWKASFEASDS